jgi:hypothetical protein
MILSIDERIKAQISPKFSDIYLKFYSFLDYQFEIGNAEGKGI